jgi:DNA polymerase-3 subunit alpha
MFVNLHNHSYYSLLDGLPKPEHYVLKAKEHGSPAIALTDHGVLYGAVEFYMAAKKNDIQPLIGCEVYLTPYSRHSKNPGIDNKRYHLVLIAKSNAGYENLIQLVTKAHLEGMYYKPRIDWELLEQYGKDLIGLTACLGGEIPQAIIAGKPEEEIMSLIKRYQQVLGSENFFLEIQPHFNLEEQARVNAKIVELSRRYHIPIVATSDAHYINPEDNIAQDILICIQTDKQIDDPTRMNMSHENYSLRSPEEMKTIFADVPEAITNTLAIAQMCHVEIPLGKNLIPSFQVPGQKTPQSYVRELCFRGICERYQLPLDDVALAIMGEDPAYDLGEKSLGDITPEELRKLSKTGFSEQKNDLIQSLSPEQQKVIERLEYELLVINKMNFDTYFLIVQDFVNWAKNQGISVGPGRGSAGGSIVAYALKITDVDPLKYDLLFERFLNPARISMPDIDMDFADTRRDEVLEYVRQKYGRDHVAQISTFGTMAARQAVKDVGRALGVSFGEMNEVVKLIPERPGTKLQEALDTQIELKKLYTSNPLYKKIFDIALKIEGVVRHISVHACAVVISDEPLTKYTALQVPPKYASEGEEIVISQLSAKPLEALGLLKIDFLGLRNLSIIQKALKIIQRTQKEQLQIAAIPLDDKKTFDLFSQGETMGVFQFESAGMRRYLKELKPSRFEDIIAMVALYRPGPMEWIPDYIAYKHGKKKVTYPHDDLKTILEGTYGIAIYQEQILQIVQKFAGFSLGEADILRRAIGKKIIKELMAQKEKFMQKAIAIGHTEKEALFIFEKVIEPFAGYGFNKSHAACYAMIAYQTAYLKAHYPTEFMAALLSSDTEDADRIAMEVHECEQMGITVLPPAINESLANFTVSGTHEIRFGLRAIKGLGGGTIDKILEEREKGGPFSDIAHFAKRISFEILNKKSLEALILSGAMDLFGSRKALVSIMDDVAEYAKHVQSSAHAGQVSLFHLGGDDASFDALPVPKMEQESYLERLKWEKTFLGLYISGHPLDGLKKYFKKKATLIEDITDKDVGKVKIIMGMIDHIRKIYTKNKEPMLYLQIEDPTGTMEMIVFPKLFKMLTTPLQEDMLVIASGRLDKRNGLYQLSCNELKTMDLAFIIQKAKDEKFYDPALRVSRLKVAESLDEEEMEDVPLTVPLVVGEPAVCSAEPLFIEKEVTQDYIIEVPNIYYKEDLMKLQDVLKNHEAGNHDVYFLIQGKKIRTNMKVQANEVLKEKVAKIFSR